jgi:peptidoglycan/xylan/chitin deacetylase (PgdA/CDA1 family)
VNRRNALAAAAAITAMAFASAGCDAEPTGPTRSAAPVPTPNPTPTAAPTPTLGALPAQVTTGPGDRPSVALTFHGQGDPALVTRLLAELASAGVAVTVMAVGSWLTAQPEMAHRILDGGHELGNHTQNHLAIADMSAAKAFAEIDQCAQTLKRLTGSIGTWFRPSQTQYATPTIQAQAAKVGYRTCLSYDVDSLDYTDPGPDAIVRNTLGAVRNGSIVSLHFGHSGTVTALPALLDGLRSKGLSPVTMTDMMSR